MFYFIVSFICILVQTNRSRFLNVGMQYNIEPLSGKNLSKEEMEISLNNIFLRVHSALIK